MEHEHHNRRKGLRWTTWGLLITAALFIAYVVGFCVFYQPIDPD